MSKTKLVKELEERVKVLEIQVEQQQLIIQDLLHQVFQMKQVLPNKEKSDKETHSKIQDRTHLFNLVVSKKETSFKCPALNKDEIYWCGPSAKELERVHQNIIAQST
ncbi:hypothetical protein L9F63_027247 [Diploptera punctata]|uniref:Uncharacterized protein n=1 Tax=Diploptera punctata TaxID=6984 RepID=A0AAD7ZRH7_DIPPU|nr:hypothetical protein L9F63_002716 [Diploptera punctata]KAJ9595369.1 hypothetical protein L9F63_027247 [Diploptera punctata]